MTAYWELLRDPRWQRKRLEVMERENFACQDCGAKDRTLNVHHTYYAKGRKPWEYENESLQCLCEDCHEQAERQLRLIRCLAAQLSQAWRVRLIGYLQGLARAVELGCEGTSVLQGIADALGVETEDVLGDDWKSDDIASVARWQREAVARARDERALANVEAIFATVLAGERYEDVFQDYIEQPDQEATAE